jgi:hypothetical protein
VHHVGGSDVDCTLINQPFHVSKMKKGDRSRQPLAMLTDWSIMTPFGAINPRSQASARFIREHPELLAMMKMMGG